MKRALIIFVRKPERGKVKTRLAATIGDDAALQVYKQLLLHTFNLSMACEADKFIFYAENIETDDVWSRESYYKCLQSPTDLGGRMQAAFRTVFDEGYQQAVIIGSDCLQLTPDHLKEAYRVLEHHDIVIGPARDGGYYLLGMNKLHDALFHDIKWSTEYVFAETVQRINTWQLRYSCLEMLTDVDEETDLPPDWKTRLLYQEKH